MKNIIALLVCIFCASVCWGQNGYKVDYQAGASDITSYLPTVNVWKALPVKTLISQVMAGDGAVFVLDSGGCPFFYDNHARTYTQRTTWGCGWSEITSLSDTAIWVGLLKPDAGCPSGTKRFYWSYDEQSVPTNTTWCATHWYGSPSDDAQLQLNLGGTNSYFWTGTTSIPIGNGWTAGNVASATNACAVKSGQIYLLQGDLTFTAMPSQPGSGVSGCTITTDVDSVFAWGSFGVKRFDFHSTTWNVVTGLSGVLSMTTGRKGTTLALDSAGHPKHLNVYAGFISATLSGSYTGCPTPQQPCGTTTHTGSAKITLPGGLFGLQGTQTVAPNVNMHVTSFDVSPDCDPFFGDPTSPSCSASIAATVLCNQSHQFIQGGASQLPPPTPPPIPSPHWSEYMGYWDGNSPNWNNPVYFPLGGKGGWLATIQCGDTDASACGIGTYAVCNPTVEPAMSEVSSVGVSYGNAATQAAALKAAQLNCAGHTHGGGRAWGTFSNYTVDLVNQTISCVPIVVYDDKPGTPCF